MWHSQKVLLTVHLLSYSKLIKIFDIIFSYITKRALLNGHQGYKFMITWFLGPAHQRKHFVTGLHVSSRHTSHTLWHQAAMQKDLMYLQRRAVWDSFDLNDKTEPTRNGMEVAVEWRVTHGSSTHRACVQFETKPHQSFQKTNVLCLKLTKHDDIT